MKTLSIIMLVLFTIGLIVSKLKLNEAMLNEKGPIREVNINFYDTMTASFLILDIIALLLFLLSIGSTIIHD